MAEKCAWCGRDDQQMAVVRGDRTGLVLAIHEGTTIHHPLCRECLSEGKHRYPSYEEQEISAAEVLAKIMGPPSE